MRWRRRLFELSLVVGLAALLTFVLNPRSNPPPEAAAPAVISGTILAPVASPDRPRERGRRGRGGPPAPVRSDIAEGRPGQPLAVRFVVVDDLGNPAPNARVEIWHADSDGVYSRDPETFCKGAQITDALGQAAFTTIRPGREGRGHGHPHVHFKVKAQDGSFVGGSVDVPDEPGTASSTSGASASLVADGSVLAIRATLERSTAGSCGSKR